MKTMTASKALAEILEKAGRDDEGKPCKKTKGELYHEMELVEPGINRQKVYDRLRADNPQVRMLNSLIAHLGYSLVLVPSGKAVSLPNTCYRLIAEEPSEK